MNVRRNGWRRFARCKYRHVLLGQKPEEILSHAFEYSVRQDILTAMEELNLSAQQAAALLESPFPWADIYKDFRDMETGHMETVWECVVARADKLVDKHPEVQQEAVSVTPLYQESVGYAKDYGEIELFRESYKANIACRNAIDAAIQEGHDGLRMNVEVKDILAEFGQDRVSHVLAAAILDKTWDQRISRGNKTWAASVPMFDVGDFHRDYAPRSHPLLLDGFVDTVRKEMEAMKQAEKKPSIKKQLVMNLVSGDKPSKPKEREAR